MSTPDETTLNQIITVALRQGLIDIFRVMYWFSNQTPQETVVQEIENLARNRRAESNR